MIAHVHAQKLDDLNVTFAVDNDQKDAQGYTVVILS